MYAGAPPRAVQITDNGKTIQRWMAALLFAVLFLIAGTWLDRSLASQQVRNNIVGVAVLLAAISFLFWRLRHHRSLVSTGEFATAQVIKSEIVRSGRTSSRRYDYEFPDQLNRKWKGKFAWTVVGEPLKTVEVFYNPQNPQDHIVSLKACYQPITTAGD